MSLPAPPGTDVVTPPETWGLSGIWGKKAGVAGCNSHIDLSSKRPESGLSLRRDNLIVLGPQGREGRRQPWWWWRQEVIDFS